MVSTWVSLMWVIISPVFRPQALAGEQAPSWVATSERPTTMTPRANSLMPTVWPTGTSFLPVPMQAWLSPPPDSPRPAVKKAAASSTASARARVSTQGLVFLSSFNFHPPFLSPAEAEYCYYGPPGEKSAAQIRQCHPPLGRQLLPSGGCKGLQKLAGMFFFFA